MNIDSFLDDYGRLVDQWIGRAPQKSLVDFSDAEIAQEHHRRAMAKLGDQTKTVSMRAGGVTLCPHGMPSRRLCSTCNPY